MATLVDSINELNLDKDDYVDIYVSCDMEFVEDLLVSYLAYHNTSPNIPQGHPDLSFVAQAQTSGRRADYYSHHNGTFLDAIRTTDEALMETRAMFGKKGFPSQSMIRLYKSRGNISETHIEELVKVFNQFSQYVAVVSKDHERAYVRFS